MVVRCGGAVSVTPAPYGCCMLSRRTVLGSAGSVPKRLARRRRLGALALGLSGAVVAALLLVAGAPALGLGVLAGAFVGRGILLRRARRAEAGERAEHRAAGGLTRLRADVVAYNARLPGRSGDVDIVVLGPMTAAVEVKLGTGRVRIARDGSVHVGGRRLPGRPLHQAVSNAAALRRTLGLRDEVDAVLCVTEMRQRPRLVDVDGWPVWITAGRHLRRVIRRLPGDLPRDVALDLSERLR